MVCKIIITFNMEESRCIWKTFCLIERSTILEELIYKNDLKMSFQSWGDPEAQSNQESGLCFGIKNTVNRFPHNHGLYNI